MFDCARTVPFVILAPPVPQPPPLPRPKAMPRAKQDSAPTTLAPQLFTESDQLSAALHRRVESFRTFSIGANRHQLYPKSLPPGTEPAGVCIEHRGGNILACSVCNCQHGNPHSCICYSRLSLKRASLHHRVHLQPWPAHSQAQGPKGRSRAQRCYRRLISVKIACPWPGAWWQPAPPSQKRDFGWKNAQNFYYTNR